MKIAFSVEGGTDDLYHCIPHREGDVEDFIIKNLQNGDVFIDIGANVGYYTLLGSKIVGETGHVFAIEPVPQTVKVLKLNVSLNGFKNITVIDKAAWCVSNLVKLKVPRKEFGFASVFCKEGAEIYAEAMPLDSMLMNLIDDTTHISLIKIDVEGAEYEVLLGAKEILKRTHFLVIELTRKVKECLRILQECGFEF
ncbi:MAG: FkbM family methyltransferase, partial [Candidatus Bathyarchaeia archaeon]